ncbi:hypothetical protein EH220_01310 [bacterium]|nr:MAG: hypothetical protein EH220_01310 [bacterium]
MRQTGFWIAVCLLCSDIWWSPVLGFEWYSLAPNPSYSRDLAMGASTLALDYAPQNQSINPAGMTCFPRKSRQQISFFFNPGGMWQTKNYIADEAETQADAQQVVDVARLLVSGVAVRKKEIAVALLLSQPVMMKDDPGRYHNFESKSSLGLHQNSIIMKLLLHPRVALGGRVDRFYRYAYPEDEAYSYGVILKPRGIQVGVQYQRFPSSGPRYWHPLDRRSDSSTSAGIALDREAVKVTFQVMNLTESDKPAFLEPRAGIEWRPARSIALRAGGIQFSRSHRWALTTGVGLVDVNWIRNRAARLLVPDDLVQFALAIVYNQRRPEIGIGSLTFGWRL